MIEKALQHGVRFGYVAIDAGYGKDAAFLRGVDNLGCCAFVADVHCKQMIYLEDPAPHIPDWNGRGRRPIHLKAQSEAIRVDQWASEQPDTNIGSAPFVLSVKTGSMAHGSQGHYPLLQSFPTRQNQFC